MSDEMSRLPKNRTQDLENRTLEAARSGNVMSNSAAALESGSEYSPQINMEGFSLPRRHHSFASSRLFDQRSDHNFNHTAPVTGSSAGPNLAYQNADTPIADRFTGVTVSVESGKLSGLAQSHTPPHTGISDQIKKAFSFHRVKSSSNLPNERPKGIYDSPERTIDKPLHRENVNSIHKSAPAQISCNPLSPDQLSNTASPVILRAQKTAADPVEPPHPISLPEGRPTDVTGRFLFDPGSKVRAVAKDDPEPVFYLESKDKSNDINEPDKNCYEALVCSKRWFKFALVAAISAILTASIILNIYFATVTTRGIHIPARVHRQTAPMHNKITRQDPEVVALIDQIPPSKKMFYGINYNPAGAQFPNCKLNQRDITLDIAALSRLTTRVRLYSTDCDQGLLVANAIQDLDLDLTISLGVWINSDTADNARQMKQLKTVLTEHPARLFNSILVGNEVLYRQSRNILELIDYINEAQEYVKRRGLEIPVGSSEIGSRWTRRLAQEVDIVAANIHPFFGGISANNSAQWILNYLQDPLAREVSFSDKQVIISEVGWPSSGDPFQEASAGIPHLQKALDDWICANSSIGWYWYEAFDDSEEDLQHFPDRQAELKWGILNRDCQLKNLTIPTCV